LHGIDTIVNAASIIEKNQKNIRWVLVGKGQEQEKIDALIKKNNLKSIHRISWIPYEKLINYIADSDVCLGIFGASGKSLRVIPNKVYQILAAGKPLITADTPAIREILGASPILRLITPGNQDALVSAVLEVRNHLTTFDFGTAESNRRHAIGYVEVGNQFSDIVEAGKRS
jgi:glycosyltransferase involved in cell wall biosynthesis